MDSFETRARALRGAYAAFNERRVADALDLLHPEVEWPNMIEGGTLRGREAVTAYWEGQFATIDPKVEPIEIALGADLAAVFVEQSVRVAEGARQRGTLAH